MEYYRDILSKKAIIYNIIQYQHQIIKQDKFSKQMELYFELIGDNNLENELKTILSKIDENQRILIVSECSEQTTSALNNIIEWISVSNNKFPNLTIYNLTTDIKKIIWQAVGENKIKKSINIFANILKIENPEDYTPRLVTQPQLHVTYYSSYKGKDFMYSYLSSHYDQTDIFYMQEQWWYKKYFRVPICATGRLRQFTGTCWFNSTINSLFLIPEIVEILKQKWNNLEGTTQTKLNHITLEACPSAEISYTDMIYVLINNILIKKTKIKNNINFIDPLAQIAKKTYVSETKLPYEHITEEGGHGMLAIGTILNELFTPIIEYNMLDLDETNNIHNKLNEINKLKIELDVTTPTGDREQWIKFVINYLVDLYETNLIQTTKLLGNIAQEISDTTGKYTINAYNINTIDDINMYMGHSQTIYEMPQFLVILCKQEYMKTAVKKIYYNNTNYNLAAAQIIFPKVIDEKINHIVTGLVCDNVEYIYDSNDVLVYDNWSRGSYNNYKKHVINVGRVEPFMTYIIYVKEKAPELTVLTGGKFHKYKLIKIK